MKKAFYFSFTVLVAVLFLFPFCRLYKMERKLDPVNAEFLSKVRYIISREERKIFLELPDEEKEEFKKEFWKRRDPDPDTEENEFKIEYFNRIERANGLFQGEGRPGWLTDRGRIYVLFGPPTDRITYPMGEGPYDRCSEIWYYGQFPVLFYDYYCNGNYELVTLNLAHLHDLNLAQSYQQRKYKKEKDLIDFDWKIRKTLDVKDRVEGVIVIEVPYGVIWYKSVEDKLETTLDVSVEIRDFKKTLIWEHKVSFFVEIAESELEEKRREKFRIEIPFVLEDNLDSLRKGKSLVYILLENRTGGEKSKKIKEFRLSTQQDGSF